MKKVKILIASVLVSGALISAPVHAGPGDKKPPQDQTAQAPVIWLDWFKGLLNF